MIARALPGLLSKLRRPALTVAGLGCFTVAGWLVAAPLGLVVAGGSCILLEWLTADDRPGT